jgi:hypothetical protein
LQWGNHIFVTGIKAEVVNLNMQRQYSNCIAIHFLPATLVR